MKKKLATGLMIFVMAAMVGCGTNKSNVETSVQSRSTVKDSTEITKKTVSSEKSKTEENVETSSKPEATVETNKTNSEEVSETQTETPTEQANNITQMETETTAEENNLPDAKTVVQNCINGILSSTSLDEANIYFASESNEEAKSNTYNSIQNMGNLEITNALIFDAEANTYGVIFTFVQESTGNSNFAYMMFKEVENGEYVWYADEDIQNAMLQRHACSTCGGSGIIASSNQVTCSICGGTGQQYIPNMYYDNVMGWYGGYTICSGCSGAGYTTGYDLCGTCSGLGIVLD